MNIEYEQNIVKYILHLDLSNMRFFANKSSLYFFENFIIYLLIISLISSFLIFLHIRIYLNCKEINFCLKSVPLLQFSTECFLCTKKFILLILSYKNFYLAKFLEYYIKSQSCISYFNRFRMTKM